MMKGKRDMAKSVPEMFREANEETLQHILRQAESHLNAQLSAATSADQRAISFAGILAASIAVIGAAAAALLLADQPDMGLGSACLVALVGLLLAMGLANFSAAPVSFYFVGISPDDWIDDVLAKRPWKDCIAEQLAHYSEMIEENAALMKRNGRLMQSALWSAWGGLFLGAIVALWGFAG